MFTSTSLSSSLPPTGARRKSFGSSTFDPSSPPQGPMTVLAYFIISGLSNCILAMLNAIVGDLAAGREELEGGLTQQYGRLGAWASPSLPPFLSLSRSLFSLSLNTSTFSWLPSFYLATSSGMAIGLAMMVGPMLGPSIQQFNVSAPPSPPSLAPPSPTSFPCPHHLSYFISCFSSPQFGSIKASLHPQLTLDSVVALPPPLSPSLPSFLPSLPSR